MFYLGVISVTLDTAVIVGGLTLSELAFIASFICCIGAVLSGAAVARVPALLIFGVSTYSLGGLVSTLASDAVFESGTSVIRAAYVMLFWAWTAVMVLGTREQILRAVLLWAISAAISGLGAVGDVAGVIEGRAQNRATGFSTHANELGGACAVAVVPALMLAVVRGRSGGRLLLGALAGLALGGVVLSGSVAAMAAATLALIVWLSAPAIGGFGRIVVAVAVAAAFAVASVAGGVTPPGERITQVTAASGATPQEGSGSYRVAMWREAWPEIIADPFIGQGLSNDERAISFVEGSRSYVAHVHGAPVAAWYESGIFGLLGLVIVFIGLIHAGWRSAASAASDDQLIGWSIVAAFAAFAVIASAGPLYFQGYGWLAAAVLTAWHCSTVARAAPDSSLGGLVAGPRTTSPEPA